MYGSANAVVPVAAELRSELGLSGSGAAIFLLPFAIGFGAGSFLWFAVARRRSPRLLLPLSLGGVAAAAAAMILVHEPAVAVVSRFAVGVASAGYPAAAQAVITRGVAPAARGRMIGGFVAAVVAGSFVGQALAGAIADLASVDAAIGVVCVAAPLAVAATLLPQLPPGLAAAAAPEAGEHARLGALLARQWPVLAVAGLSFGGYWLLLSEVPVVLREERFDLTAAQVGALSTLGLLGVLTAMTTGRMADRLGQRAPMVATLALGVAGLAATVADAVPLAVFAVGYGVFLSAYWGYMPVASAEVAARSGPGDRQPALMAFYAAMWTGAAVAPAASWLLPGWTAAALLVLAAWAVALVVAAATFTPAGREPR